MTYITLFKSGKLNELISSPSSIPTNTDGIYTIFFCVATKVIK